MSAVSTGSAVTTIDSLLGESARRHAARPALTAEGRDLSYRDLEAAAGRLATRLAPDVGPGQRVGIIAPNAPALALALCAIWRLGGVAVPLSARYREYELRQILRDAAPVAVVSVEAHGGYSFAALLPALLPDLPTVCRYLFVDAWGRVTADLARAAAGHLPPAMPAAPLDPTTGAILYTSGTTGEPKGALVTHRREVEGAAAINDVLRATPEDCCAFVVPLSHAFGLSCFVAALAAGSRALLVESTFSPGPMLGAIEGHGATMLHGSPTLFSSLLKAADGRPGRLRTGFVAGAPCSPALLESLDDAGLPILNLYGMTEIGAAACCRAEDPPSARYTTVGRRLPGHEFRIVGGEVQVRGYAVTSGYFGQPEQTAAAFDGEWFRTGDLGALDEGGYLSIAGRAKEVAQVAGLTVYPAEVEGLLLTHPDVERAVVVSVPHEAMGEALQAFVVARPAANLTPAALLRFARPRIAGYKLPYAIHLVAEIPTLASGKPDRRALIAALLEGVSAD